MRWDVRSWDTRSRSRARMHARAHTNTHTQHPRLQSERDRILRIVGAGHVVPVEKTAVIHFKLVAGCAATVVSTRPARQPPTRGRGRLDQLTECWTGKNTRNNLPLLAIGSKVRVVAKAADKQGDEPPPKKTSAQKPTGVGWVASSKGGWWFIDFGGGSKHVSCHAKDLQVLE